MIALEQFDHDAILASADRPVWVVDEQSLAELCDHWRQCALVAIDTEFIRTDTFYPIPGLIQLSDNHCCYLIDPLSIDDFGPFKALLEDPQVIKVLHSPGEDLELFKHSYDVMPSPLMDTQLAAAFIGWGASMGLQRMLKHAFDVDLEKGETRSDWLQRPLTPEQERYAALDVAYLPKLAHIQLDELERLGRLAWLEEEMTLVLQAVGDDEAGMRDYYLRFSQLFDLSIPFQAALRDLAYWREKTIRELDKPRNRVLSNKLVVEIIKRKVHSVKQLSEIKGVQGWIMGRHGEEIIGLLHNRKASAELNPPEPIPKPLSPRWHQPAKDLMKELNTLAHEIDVPVEVLARKRDIEALIRFEVEEGAVMPEALQGWRAEVVAKPLLAKFKVMSETAE